MNQKIADMQFNEALSKAGLEIIDAGYEVSELYAHKFCDRRRKETEVYPLIEEDLIDIFGENYRAEIEYSNDPRYYDCDLSKKYLWKGTEGLQFWLCQLWMAKLIGKIFVSKATDYVGFRVGSPEFDRWALLKIAQKVEMYLQKHGRPVRFIARPNPLWRDFSNLINEKELFILPEGSCANFLQGKSPELFRLWEKQDYPPDEKLIYREINRII